MTIIACQVKVVLHSERNYMRSVSGKLRFLAVTLSLAAAGLPLQLPGASTTNWVAFNDHVRSSSTDPKVNSYTLTQTSNVGQPQGGPLTNFLTGQLVPNNVGVAITSAGRVDGTTGSSAGPTNSSSPAALIFSNLVDWTGSALYFGGSSQAAASEVRFSFTNLTPGAIYKFRGAAIRGNNYATRWAMATIDGASSYTAAHEAGVGSYGIVTNGWSPYGDTLAPNKQAAWDSGENRCGDVIGWDDIVPVNNSFSIICSNWTVATPGGAGNSSYAYAFQAFMLVEVGEATPVVITEQPAAETIVEELRPFSLRVQGGGTAPQFQWYHDGVPITGATSPTYSVASASLSPVSDGGIYYCNVYNGVSSSNSDNAVVTVNADVTPPSVIRIATINRDQVVVEFSEPMATNEFITDAFNYYSEIQFDNWAPLLNNQTTVILAISPNQDPAVGDNTEYNLTIDAQGLITDLKGNALPVVATTFRTMAPNRLGGLAFEVFATGAGSSVSNLTTYAGFPNSPRETFSLTNFDTQLAYPTDAHDNYGGRIRGWFIPPFSGKWNLFIRSDDASELWFNASGPEASGLALIAHEPGCCNAFQEPGPTVNQTSAALDLQAGQTYCVEALYKQGTGGDYCVVAARFAGDTARQVPADATPAASLLALSDGAIGAPYLPAGLGGDITIATQPASLTVESPNAATVSVAASTTTGAPLLYQWERSDDAGVTFIPIAGASGQFYTIPAAFVVPDSGAQFRCVMTSIEASVTSDAATLTVNPDTTGPTVVSAAQAQDLSGITITFSEPVEAISATTPGNYRLCDNYNGALCVNVVSVTLSNNDTQAILTTEATTPGTIYLLTVSSVTDTNGNTIRAPNSAIVGTWTSFQQGVNGYAGCQDTEIRAANPANNYATAVIILTDNSDGGGVAQALLRFDNLFGSGAGQIPPGSTINSATLRLSSTNANAQTGGTVGMHPMLVDWSQSTATWNFLTNGVQYDGSEATAEIYSSFVPNFTDPVTAGAAQTRDIDVTSSLRAWANGTFANHGWVLINPDSDGYRFNSLESAVVSERPLLTVNYASAGTTNPVVIVTDPANTTINEGQTLTFTVGVTGTLPSFQWFKDDAEIAGATSATYTLNNANETHSGKYYCRVSNLVNSVQSADAFATVNPDTNAPTLVSALGTTDPSVITITFSRALTAETATNVANYAVALALGGGELTINSATLSPNGTTVTLNTSARTSFAHYQLTVSNVRDTAYRQNLLTPSPTRLFLRTQVGVMAATSNWRYEATGTALDGMGWFATDFVDGAWPEGGALFVAKRGTPGAGDIPIVTTLPMTNDVTGLTNLTYYFRTHFTMPATPPAGVPCEFQVRPILDDGAVFYINGQEARRVGMTNEGPITYSTFATRGQGNDYRFEGPYALPTDNVVFGGDNVLAVEVHQNNLTSSDVAFAAELLYNVPALEMRISIRYENGQVVLTWPAVPGYQLHQADNVEGTYSPVPGGPSGSHTVPAPLAEKKFYRLVEIVTP